jgi:hypothetical protein
MAERIGRVVDFLRRLHLVDLAQDTPLEATEIKYGKIQDICVFAVLGELFLNGGGAQADLRAEAPRITTSIGRGS